MKTEIALEELLKQITPLPWIPTGRAVYSKGGLEKGGQIAYTGDSPHAAYLTHCANVLPEVLATLKDMATYFKDGTRYCTCCKLSTIRGKCPNPKCPIESVVSRAEKVTLP